MVLIFQHVETKSSHNVSVNNNVNSEIFARVYYRETSHMQSFMKIKSSQNGKITLLTTDLGKSYPSGEIFWS